MRIFMRFAVACTVLLVSASASVGQQKKTPSLSTDDIISPSNRSTGTVSVSAEGVNWATYTPDNAGLSLELPGEPRKFDMPMPVELQRQAPKIAMYAYVEDQRLSVVVLHMVPKKGSKAEAELKDFAAVMARTIARKSGNEAEFDVKIIDNSTVSIKREFDMNGAIFAMEGIAKAAESHVWIVVTICTLGDDGSSQARARRVLDSLNFQ